MVNATGTTTVLSSLPNPSNVNQSVAFTATVTPTTVTGTVVPQSGTVVFATTSPAITTLCTNTVSNGIVPVCNYTFTSNGSYSVTATFSSTDPNFTGSVWPLTPRR